jgi:transmembrane sensor
MALEEKIARILLKAHYNDDLTESERKYLSDWMNKPGNAEYITDGLKDEHLQEDWLILSSMNSARIKNMIGETIQEKMDPAEPSRLYTYLAAASLVGLVLLAGVLLHFRRGQNGSGQVVVSKGNDILPGTNKAILTLGDGSQVALDQLQAGSLTAQGEAGAVKKDSTLIEYHKIDPLGKTAIVYNTITVPRGGQFKLMLSDGTKVWLNASSSMYFPTFFSGKDRTVTVTGEAYFEVAKNARSPFHVIAGGTNIEVLGTHFNVNSYTNEDAQLITLVDGSVKIIGQGRQAVVLEPGDQAAVANTPSAGSNSNVNSKIVVNKVVTADIIAWTNNFFSFDHADLQAVLRQLSRWYTIEVQYPKGPIEGCYFDGNIDRELPLSKVLDILQSRKIHFQIDQGKTLLVTP